MAQDDDPVERSAIILFVGGWLVIIAGVVLFAPLTMIGGMAACIGMVLGFGNLAMHKIVGKK